VPLKLSDPRAVRQASLRDARRWAPVFGGWDPSRLEGFDLVVVDAVADRGGVCETTPSDVHALHEQGTLVLAYLSVGTVEAWRHYADSVPPDWKLAPVEDWDGEQYVDARRPGWRELMATEARRLAAACFDGLYLDNLDVGEDFPETQDGLVELVEGLRAAAPALLLVAQNGLAVAERLPIDAIAHEDVFWRFDGGYRASRPAETSELLAGLRPLRDRGLPVFTLDYAEPGSSGAAEALTRSLAEGFCPAVSILELDQLPHATPGA